MRLESPMKQKMNNGRGGIHKLITAEGQRGHLHRISVK